jgi:hypothetical protein
VNDAGVVRKAVFMDVTILSGDRAGEVFEDAELVQAVFVKTLKNIAGKGEFVAGRMTGGPTAQKPNQGWEIADPTKADIAIAEKHLAANAPAPF